MKHIFRTKVFSITLGSLMAFSVMADKPAAAGGDPFLGELMLVGYSFCPKGWTEADGDLLPINNYQSLYSLYTTMYGGDGRTEFGIPGLRGRAPISAGQGPNLPNYPQGQKGGAEDVALQPNNMPSHNHGVRAVVEVADKEGPGTDFLATHLLGFNIYHPGPPDTTMDTAMIINSGHGQEITKRSPYQVLRWCVALQGTFPSRP